jgi:hypothetical protein
MHRETRGENVQPTAEEHGQVRGTQAAAIQGYAYKPPITFPSGTKITGRPVVV